MGNQQMHKRLSLEQVKTIFDNYFAKEISAKDARDNLGIQKSHFYRLATEYENNPDGFNLGYERTVANNKIDSNTEEKILTELEADKKLIDNKDIAIRYYNYSAIKENLEQKHKIKISVNTIINRAKKNHYYLEKTTKKAHDHEVLTNCLGELIQGDSSHHLWSPYMDKKLYLITYLDDHSRLILYADLVEVENAWSHICALKSMFLRYGCPLKIYVDQHSIFRYVRDRDKNQPHNLYTKFTGDVITQYEQVLKECNVNIVYALSPQAKGKIERPYRWIQDRIVRTAAKEKLTTIEELRKVLHELIEKYNTKWIHSTTKEIPIIRFENAMTNNKSLFRQFKLQAPYKDLNDIFCLRAQRTIDNYRKISLNGIELKVPNGVYRQIVDIKASPDYETGNVEIRFWQYNSFIGKTVEKIANFKKFPF